VKGLKETWERSRQEDRKIETLVTQDARGLGASFGVISMMKTQV